MSKKMLAAGYFGYGNFGDELILDIFRQRLKNFEIAVLPKMAKHPAKTLFYILSSDAVVFPGGSVFQDETSIGNVLFWCYVVLAARISGKPVFLLDQGFELKKKLSVFLVKTILKNASMISTRDKSSLKLLRKLGLNPVESADAAFRAEIPREKPNYPPKKIGIIPRGNFAQWEKILSKIPKKFPGSDFEIAAVSPQDKKIAEKISKKISNGEKIKKIRRLDEMSRFLKNTDLLIAAPFHAVLCAAASGTPFIAVGYSAKIEKFLAETGLENRLAERMPEDLKLLYKKPLNPNFYRMLEESSFQIFLNLLQNRK
ncbi:MAG: polysaccharide pyruvyl transferase family protein [Elusimicrobia bacterium]|nr:polysaccharide pyruvyl transferase family protein [Elusimicrobiota bacterium]